MSTNNPATGPDTANETNNSEPDNQDLNGYSDNAQWDALLNETGAMLNALDEIEDNNTRQTVVDTLANIDAIHRESLHRLVALFKEGVLEQVVTDPAIHTLMGMYDLLPLPEQQQAQPEQASWQKITDFTGKSFPQTDSAWQATYNTTAGEQPHWSPAPLAEPLKDKDVAFCDLQEGAYLLAKIDAKFYALHAYCNHHRALMDKGRLEGYSWICPHGPACVYDMRNGTRLGGGEPLDCRPVKVSEQNRYLIGFGMRFEPKLPAF